jgi:hypothetical protein
MVRVAERTRMKGQRTLRTRSECDTGVRGTPGRIAARKERNGGEAVCKACWTPRNSTNAKSAERRLGLRLQGLIQLQPDLQLATRSWNIARRCWST